MVYNEGKACRTFGFMNKVASVLKYFFLFVFLFLLSNSVVTESKASENLVPDFPNCEDKIFTQNGDRAHYNGGIHGIPGVGNIEGRDDVYTLTEGNFLQCFCPENGSGIQSNWWNVSNLSQGEIDGHKTNGWMFEQSGSGWNLLDDPYLIKNRSFSCSLPTPTPVPSVTPTNVPFIPTPTSGPRGLESKCYDLEASPSEGTAPLTVRFQGHADDPATQGKIRQYRFDFADASGGQPQVVLQSDKVAYHRYEISGNYKAMLRIQDNAGNWRESGDCEIEIKVHAAPQVLGASSPEVLPATGLPETAALLVLVLSPLGFYLYRRFRLV